MILARQHPGPCYSKEIAMAKKSRRRKARAKSKANHGKRPNA
jgi:hypothetical protein